MPVPLRRGGLFAFWEHETTATDPAAHVIRPGREILTSNDVLTRQTTLRMISNFDPGESRLSDRTSEINVVPRGGIEPPTLRFSVACSTN
jgi:hypothetical protein